MHTAMRNRTGLYRSRHGAIRGVCRGVAEYLDFSVFWTRAIAVALLIFTGFWPMLGIYFLASLVMKGARPPPKSLSPSLAVSQVVPPSRVRMNPLYWKPPMIFIGSLKCQDTS